jgi:hypothetical protein
MPKTFLDPLYEQHKKETLNLLGQLVSGIKKGSVELLEVERTLLGDYIFNGHTGISEYQRTGIENVSIKFFRTTTTQEDN